MALAIVQLRKHADVADADDFKMRILHTRIKRQWFPLALLSQLFRTFPSVNLLYGRDIKSLKSISDIESLELHSAFGSSLNNEKDETQEKGLSNSIIFGENRCK